MSSLLLRRMVYTLVLYFVGGTFSVAMIMRPALRNKIVAICNQKIAQKGDAVGLSFYAFFQNKNDDPVLLMEVATWWIETKQLDHFEKAVKIKQLILEDDENI
jgi:hypothetical protein